MAVRRLQARFSCCFVYILCILLNSLVFGDLWRQYSPQNKESNEIPQIPDKDLEYLPRYDDENFQKQSSDKLQRQSRVVVSSWRRRVAEKNLASFLGQPRLSRFLESVKDKEIINYIPGQPARPFVLYTLDGKLEFPLGPLKNRSVLFMVYDKKSGFSETLWNSDEALKPFISDKTPNAHYVFIPTDDDAVKEAKWLQKRIRSQASTHTWEKVKHKFHFVVQSISQLGNWLPSCLKEWRCVDHGCGLDQVLIHSNSSKFPVVLKRIDARYDWLPSPVKFHNKTFPLVFAEDGCTKDVRVAGAIALVSDVGCNYYKKISNMAESSALGVLIYVSPDHRMKDMNCDDEECMDRINIPASMISFSPFLLGSHSVQFQTSPSDNLYMAIDAEGKLTEVGWFLYPSASFIVWQAQWMAFKDRLQKKLQQKAKVVPIFENSIMKGKHGVLVNVTLPPLEELRNFSTFEIHADLSCPGTKDTTCPHWDRTVGLHVCCDPKSPLCGMELGRWITPFRRRVGSWLTDVSPLLPLLSTRQCTFHMYTDPWASPWKPSINLRFSNAKKPGDIYPAETRVLYEPGATFDHNYNSHFKPYTFFVSTEHKKVAIYAVITGHGSDDNGCGEFCVTSHHFLINGKTWHSIKFTNAGTPLGCANRVSEGVVPNEHGTWLYGRDGWCDGQQVNPWVIDITKNIDRTINNTIQYFGYFNQKDPHPTQNPGIISMYSYLVFYKTL